MSRLGTDCEMGYCERVFKTLYGITAYKTTEAYVLDVFGGSEGRWMVVFNNGDERRKYGTPIFKTLNEARKLAKSVVRLRLREKLVSRVNRPPA